MPISALSTALQGLEVSQQLLNVTSQNLANAQTPGYTEKTLPLSTNVAGSTVSVQTGVVSRSVNQFLQTDYWNSVSTSNYYNSQTTYLTNLQQISGTPGNAASMASLLNTVSGDFTALSADPSSSIAQQQVVDDAQNFAGSINTLANYVQQERNTSQTDIAGSVQTINNALAQIAQLNQQIAQATYAGQSTANIADQRDQAIQTLAGQINISTFARSDGVVVVQTGTGQLLADTVAQPVVFTPTNVSFNSVYPGTLSGVVVGTGPGAFDLAAGSPGGTLGALLNLRDQILPQQQAQLDEMSEQTANAFNAAGVELFTTAAGTIPANTPGSYVGFAQQFQVNPAVIASPSLIQQGTGGGPALLPGDNSMITSVINNVFGATLAFNTAGLGAGASVPTSGLPANSTLENYANQLIAGQANTLSNATSKQTAENSYSTALQQQLTNQSGVDLDTELANMLSIQKSYGASAQMMKAVDSMFSDLLTAVAASST